MFFFFQAEDGIRDLVRSRGLGDVYKRQDQDFTIIGLTRLDGRQTVESITEFAVNEQFNYPVGISEEAFNDLLYGVGSIPHIVLIDRNGIVRKTIIGVHDAGFVEEEILKLLNE